MMALAYAFPNSSFRSLIVFLVLASCAVLRAAVIAPGDTVVTVRETPIKIGEETLAAVPAGVQLKAERVNGDWVRVNWFSLESGVANGYIYRPHLVKCDRKLKLKFIPYNGTLQGNYYQWFDLPRGESVVIQIKSTHPVDVFIFSEEGKSAYDWAIKHGHGQATSKHTKLNVTDSKFRWEPPSDGQYYFVFDNTDFPDGGAWGSRSTRITYLLWQDNLMPAEPVADRGLIIGRVTLDFDGFRRKHERYSGRLTIHIAHKSADEDDSQHEEVEAIADSDGYFAVGNLSPNRRYWIKGIEGVSFTAGIPFQVKSPIRSSQSDRKSVLDVGYFALKVDSDGSIGCELNSSSVSVTKKAGESGTIFRAHSSSPLDRHKWFLKTYPSSGWTFKVLADQSRIEREREQEANER